MQEDDATRAAGLVMGITSQFLEELSLTLGVNDLGVQQVQLLLALAVHGEIHQQDLSRYTGVERSANSRNIAKLGDGERPSVKRGPGLVESAEDPENRRLKIVRLTPEGKLILREAAGKARSSLMLKGI